ncbi:MAG: hypothetical protein A2018_01445 [Alphaproteobacteria bacterium GWF2_58_20]|nr:MAG: hypothetical protein A2018_01445 [Alphaproteobacteria bacterium GWF2_58_20]
MAEKRFSSSRVWAELDGTTATIGLMPDFLDEGTEIVMLRLPKIGQTLARGGTAAEVETLKAASEVPSPLSGTVTAINEEAAKSPKRVSESPLDKGWLFRMDVSSPSEFPDLSIMK